MNKEEFLQQFWKNLIHVSDAEREDAVRYYTEYFEEAGAENEQKVIEELGSPVMLARKISAESAIKELDMAQSAVKEEHTAQFKPEEQRTGMKNLGVIILLLCSFPVWLPLAIVMAVLVFVGILVVFILVFCVVIVGAALMVSGVLGVIVGFFALFRHFISGIMMLGAAMAMAALGILIFIGGRYLVKGALALVVTLGKRKAGRM
mgnify:CR=1 FL=1